MLFNAVSKGDDKEKENRKGGGLMNTTGNVIVYGSEDGERYVITDKGTFLHWGTIADWDIGNTGEGGCSETSAIIGLPNGMIENVPLHMIQFKMEGHREWQALIK